MNAVPSVARGDQVQYGFLLLLSAGVAFVSWSGYAITTAVRRGRVSRRLARGMGVFREGEEATVVGVVRPVTKPLIAPLSGKPCIAYDARVRIGSIRQGNREERSRVEVIPFELATDGGVIRVEAATAELLFPTVPLIPRKVAREAAFAAACGIQESMAGVDCDETCVEIGAKVAVHGVVALDSDAPSGETGYRDGAIRYKLGPHPEHALTIGAAR